MKRNMERYRDICEKLVEGKNEKYVPDGTMISLAIYTRVNQEPADAFFLYGTDFVSFSEPFARLALRLETNDILLFQDTWEHPFREPPCIPDSLYSDKDYKRYADSYIAIREFVYEESINDTQCVLLKEYIDIFRKIVMNQFESCYYEMAEDFLAWAEKVVQGR